MATRRRQGSRNEQLVRMLELIADLSQRDGCDLYALAERHGTTTRTIRRDLDALAAVGIPLKRQAGEGARLRWSIDLDAPRARELAVVATATRDGGGPREE